MSDGNKGKLYNRLKQLKRKQKKENIGGPGGQREHDVSH